MCTFFDPQALTGMPREASRSMARSMMGVGHDHWAYTCRTGGGFVCLRESNVSIGKGWEWAATAESPIAGGDVAGRGTARMAFQLQPRCASYEACEAQPHAALP